MAFANPTRAAPGHLSMSTRPAPPSAPLPSSARGAWSRLLQRLGVARHPVLARNAVWNWGVYLANAAIVFVLSPFVVHRLGTEAYGVWAIVLTLTGYLGFADLGIRPAIVHFVARYRALDDREALQRAVSSAAATFGVGGALVLVACALTAPWLPAWFHVPVALRTDATVALVVSGAALALSLPLNAWSAVLIGRERYDLTCRIDLGAALLRALGIVGALLLGFGLVGVAVAQAGVELGSMAAKTRAARRLAPDLRVRLRFVDRAAVGALLRYGAFGILATVALQLSYETDALVIGGALSIAWVAWFAVASRLPFYLRTMMWAVGRVLAPRMGALDARGDHRTLGRLAAGGSRVLLLLSTAPLVYMAVYGGAFLERWMGDAAFRVHGAVPLAVLALGAAAPIASHTLVSLHQGTNRMRALAGFALVEGVTNLGASLLLVGPLGLTGVALGTAAPALLVHGVLMPWWAARAFGFSLRGYLLRVWPLPLLAGACAALLPPLLLDPHASLGWPALLAAALITALLFAACAGLLHVLVRRREAPAALAEATS
jgi:O-antigen/teichoic acid export membrane protein